MLHDQWILICWVRTGYCGNEIRTQTGAEKIDCPVLQMMTCPNNIKQWCGGPKLMNIWYNSDPVLK